MRRQITLLISPILLLVMFVSVPYAHASLNVNDWSDVGTHPITNGYSVQISCLQFSPSSYVISSDQQHATVYGTVLSGCSYPATITGIISTVTSLDGTVLGTAKEVTPISLANGAVTQNVEVDLASQYTIGYLYVVYQQGAHVHVHADIYFCINYGFGCMFWPLPVPYDKTY